MGLEDGWVSEESGGEERLFLSPELALPFLDRRIGELAGEFRLFGTESVKKLKLRPMQPRLSLNMKDGIDYFEASAFLSFPGTAGASGGSSAASGTDETIELQQALSLFEKHNYIPLSDGSRALVNPRYFRSLRRLIETKGGTKGTVRVSLFDLPLLEELIDARLEGAGKQRLREVFEGFASIEERELPADLPLEGTLRPYQETGLKWMTYLQEKGLGGCLADDMGLGKTIQAIALLALYHGHREDAPPSLIVVPRSLLYNWKREIERFAPQLKCRSWYGADRRASDLEGADIILPTYALVRNDIDTLREREFSYIVLDEAQAIKNHNSRISKAAVLLNGRHRLALSGTPVENNLAELYSLFRFLNPAMFGSYSRFSREFIAPVRRGDDEFSMRLLGAKTAPFLLRRLKRNVASELPERTEQLLFVDMETDQARLYEERRQFYEKVIREKLKVDGVEKSQFFILQGLLELRQLAAVPEAKTAGELRSGKWEALLEHMEEVIAEGHRCLVFTNFLDSVEIVCRELEERRIPCLSMTGASRGREALVDDFQRDDRYKAFVMTMKTGGVGLNLTGADYVYILDPWWNRSAEQQAIDRTHRIGQTKNVFCYRLISRGTIEEKILDLQEKKQALFAGILGGGISDGASLSRLDAEDIEMLLEGEV
jgi:SNF2 family DNA or RNA helicase